jgi:hypothetical protein
MNKLETLKSIFEQGFIGQTEYDRRLSQLIDQLTGIDSASAAAGMVGSNSPDNGVTLKRRRLCASDDGSAGVDSDRPPCRTCHVASDEQLLECTTCGSMNRKTLITRNEKRGLNRLHTVFSNRSRQKKKSKRHKLNLEIII